MHIHKSRMDAPVLKTVARVWDHFKELRVATPPESRKPYIPEPRIIWEAESLADIRADAGRVELGDRIHLPWARWWRTNEDHVVKLQDGTCAMVLNLDRNPVYYDQYAFNRDYDQFGWQIEVPHHLLATLVPVRTGMTLYDIELYMRAVIEDPRKGPEGLSRTKTELRIWDVHLNPGEVRRYRTGPAEYDGMALD